MSKVSYKKSASKDIRPFFGAASMERALDGARIRIFAGEPFSDAVAFTIEEGDAARLSIALRPEIREADLAASEVPRGKLALAITALNPFLKRVELIHKAPLSGAPAEEVAVGPESLARLGGAGRLTVEAAILLAKGGAKQPGAPFLRGHWLAKKIFELRPPTKVEEFGIEPMDDAGFIARGLPAKTLYHVDYWSGINEPVSKDRPLARVYVHADAYKKLAADSNARIARPMMSFLAAEIPCQILALSLSDWAQDEAVAPKSPLQAFLKQVNMVESCDLRRLARLASEPGMSRLRAILHARQGSARAVAEV